MEKKRLFYCSERNLCCRARYAEPLWWVLLPLFRGCSQERALIELNESDLYPGGAIELQHNGGRKIHCETKSKVESLTQVMFPKYVDRQT